MTNPDTDTAQNGLIEEQTARAAWETPETIEIDLGNAEAAFTNSNDDGSNYSS